MPAMNIGITDCISITTMAILISSQVSQDFCVSPIIVPIVTKATIVGMNIPVNLSVRIATRHPVKGGRKQLRRYLTVTVTEIRHAELLHLNHIQPSENQTGQYVKR